MSTGKIYKAVIKSDSDIWDFMGFVDSPAHGKQSMMFNSQKTTKQVFKVDESRQVITGVAISTNQPIYRNDASGEYHIIFDKATTRELGRRMLASDNTSNLNINHNQNDLVKSSRLDEIFYIDKARGIEAPEEFKSQNLQDGSMLVSYHIADKQEFKALKEKNLNGFSIEVFIDVEKTKFQKVNQKTNTNMKEQKKSFLNHIKSFFDAEEEQKEFAEAVSVDGLNLKWEGDLAEGVVVYITAEGEEDSLATEGVHVIDQEDGQVMVTVGADGTVESVEKVEQEEEMSEVEQSLELLAKQFVKQSDELTKANETIKSFTKRFENIETKLDGKKENKEFSKKSIGQLLKK